jgi:hypothetical protein
VPRFHYQEEPTGRVAARVGRGVAGLIVPAVLLAFWGLRRLPWFPVVG